MRSSLGLDQRPNSVPYRGLEDIRSRVQSKLGAFAVPYAGALQYAELGQSRERGSIDRRASAEPGQGVRGWRV